MICKNCGQQIADNATKCDKCGADLAPAAPAAAPAGFKTDSPNGSGFILNVNLGPKDLIAPSGKNTVLAAILSCCIPGLGQIYLGQLWKGLAILILDWVLGGVTFGILHIVLKY